VSQILLNENFFDKKYQTAENPESNLIFEIVGVMNIGP